MKTALKILFVFLATACGNLVIDKEPTLEKGTWGDDNIRSTMMVESERIVFDFTCSTAEIPNTFTIKENGTFEAKGTFTRLSGAVPIDFVLKPVPATFTGKLSGNKLSLKISTEGQADETVGVYEFGKEVLVYRCP